LGNSQRVQRVLAGKKHAKDGEIHHTAIIGKLVNESGVNLIVPFQHDIPDFLLVGATAIEHEDVVVLGCKLLLKGGKHCVKLVEWEGDMDIKHGFSPLCSASYQNRLPCWAVACG
jgi:hypothetical protein